MKWITKFLADIADFRLGKMLDQAKNKGESLPYLANINVRWGEFDLSNLREMRFEYDDIDRYGLKYGDIVMCEGGEPGRCAIWKDAVPGMMIQKALHRIRPHACLDHRFLYYSFLHKGRNGGFTPLFTGATIKHLPREKLELVEITFPPLEVQCRIADTLAAYDDLIDNNGRRITLLEKAARLLYEEWFVWLRFPGHEHVRITDGLPQGWSATDLVNACVSDVGIQTGPFGSQLHQRDYSTDGTPVVMPKDIVGARISLKTIARVPDAIKERLARHVMQPGDIVMARRGDVGRKAFIGAREAGWMCGTGCMRIRPNTNKITPRFLFDTLNRPEVVALIVSRAKGAIMPNLNLSVLKDIPIVVPPVQLQRDFEALVAPVHRQIDVLSQQSEKLREARDLLLPRLIAGEVAA